MKTMADIRDFLLDVRAWAQDQAGVLAVALVGSYARDAAGEDSDVDLVLIAVEPGDYLADTGWAGQFGKVARRQVEAYGAVTSLRVWYTDGCEVEYGLTTAAWAARPLDEGTRRVIADGMRVLVDKAGLLAPLLPGGIWDEEG